MSTYAQEWLATIPNPMNRGKAAQAIGRPMRLDGGPIKSRAQHVTDLVASGATVDMGRMRVVLPDGSFYASRELTDAGVCFAEYLIVHRGDES